MGNRGSVLVGAAFTVLVIGVVVSLYFVFSSELTPREKTMHDLQRIFYYHVTSAWIGLQSFLWVLVASIGYLVKRTRSWDRVAVSAAELGVVFIAITLTTGPIWAKSAWGIWWTWDARLTSTLVLFLLFCGYLMLRRYVSDPATRAKLSAVVGIVSAVDVPIVYFAIRWWNTQHPQPVIGGGEGSGLHPDMWRTFLICLGVLLLMFTLLLIQRVQLARVEDEVEQLRKQRAKRRPGGESWRPAAWLFLLLSFGLGATDLFAQNDEEASTPSNGAVDSPSVQDLREELEKKNRLVDIELANLQEEQRKMNARNDRRMQSLFWAYTVFWAILTIYLVTIWRRQRRLTRELRELRKE